MMKTTEALNIRSFNICHHEIWNGDLLLFRKRKFGFLDSMIAIAGRGVHSHAAKAAWWNKDLFCLEVREFYGGRAVTLASQVKKYPTRIDVYRPNAQNRWPHYSADGATEIMRHFAGMDYGYLNVLTTAMTHIPFSRLFVRPSRNDEKQLHASFPPYCSEAIAIAERLGGGVDPVPQLADSYTEPADLARSPFYQYVFTLE